MWEKVSSPQDQASVAQSLSSVDSHVSVKEVNRIENERQFAYKKKWGSVRLGRREGGRRCAGQGIVGSSESLVGEAGEEAGVREYWGGGGGRRALIKRTSVWRVRCNPAL